MPTTPSTAPQYSAEEAIRQERNELKNFDLFLSTGHYPHSGGGNPHELEKYWQYHLKAWEDRVLLGILLLNTPFLILGVPLAPILLAVSYRAFTWVSIAHLFNQHNWDENELRNSIYKEFRGIRRHMPSYFPDLFIYITRVSLLILERISYTYFYGIGRKLHGLNLPLYGQTLPLDAFMLPQILLLWLSKPSNQEAPFSEEGASSLAYKLAATLYNCRHTIKLCCSMALIAGSVLAPEYWLLMSAISMIVNGSLAIADNYIANNITNPPIIGTPETVGATHTTAMSVDADAECVLSTAVLGNPETAEGTHTTFTPVNATPVNATTAISIPVTGSPQSLGVCMLRCLWAATSPIILPCFASYAFPCLLSPDPEWGGLPPLPSKVAAAALLAYAKYSHTNILTNSRTDKALGL